MNIPTSLFLLSLSKCRIAKFGLAVLVNSFDGGSGQGVVSAFSHHSSPSLLTSSRARSVMPLSSITRLFSLSGGCNNSYNIPIVSISDSYDSGNGEFVSAEMCNDDDCDIKVNVKIRPDPYTKFEQKQHFQSFSFRSTLHPNSPQLKSLLDQHDKSSIKVKYILQNAGEASYAQAFKGYDTFVTTKTTPFDPDSWVRTEDTEYDEKNGCLTWNHYHEVEFLHGERGVGAVSGAYFAYFPPYSYERHLGLIARCSGKLDITVSLILVV